jgi:hypothetical protein
MTCKQSNLTTHIVEKKSWLYKTIYIIYPPIFYIRKWYLERKQRKFLEHTAFQMAKAAIDREILESLYKDLTVYHTYIQYGMKVQAPPYFYGGRNEQ